MKDIRRIALVMLVSGCAMQEDALSTTEASVVVETLDVAINGAPVTPATSDLDYGRVIMMDGSNFVTTTTSSRKVSVATAALYTEYSTITIYDANFTPLATQNVGNSIGPADGSTTWLMNGVVDNGFYYFGGKSNVAGIDLCPLDNLPAPASSVFQPYILKYHLDATNTLVLDACVRLDFRNGNGVLRDGEISGIAIGDGRLFIGGSLGATHVAIDSVPTLVPIPDGVGKNDPAMTVGPLYDADAYVASFDLDLADMQIQKYGTKAWEEILDLQYDEVDDTIYTVGTTHGDLCTAYAAGAHPALSTTACTTGYNNTSASPDHHKKAKFDGYLAAFKWDSIAVHPLRMNAVRQFGGDGEDSFNGLGLYRPGGGIATLYLGGKYTPTPGGVPQGDMDARVVRLSADGTGANPDAIFLDATVETYVRGVVGTTEASGAMVVTATSAYVTGVRNGAARTHAGVCGDGLTSQLIPYIERFDHAVAMSSLPFAYEYVTPTLLHQSGDVREITIDTTGNRFVAYGSSNYSQSPDEDSFCGDMASANFMTNAINGGSSENMDETAGTLFFHSL